MNGTPRQNALVPQRRCDWIENAFRTFTGYEHSSGFEYFFLTQKFEKTYHSSLRNEYNTNTPLILNAVNIYQNNFDIVAFVHILLKGHQSI